MGNRDKPEDVEGVDYVVEKGRRYYLNCPSCQRERAEGNTFFPPHYASERCESGKRNHCSCGTCF